MAINKKNTENKKEDAAKLNIEVTRAKDLKDKNVIMFDMVVNGVTIYGCSYKEINFKDKEGSFVKIGFPSRKGADDKYYNHCYVKLSDEDITNIERGIEAHLE